MQAYARQHIVWLKSLLSTLQQHEIRAVNKSVSKLPKNGHDRNRWHEGRKGGGALHEVPLGHTLQANAIMATPYHSREAVLLIWNQTLLQAERCLKCTHTRATI